MPLSMGMDFSVGLIMLLSFPRVSELMMKSIVSGERKKMFFPTGFENTTVNILKINARTSQNSSLADIDLLLWQSVSVIQMIRLFIDLNSIRASLSPLSVSLWKTEFR